MWKLDMHHEKSATAPAHASHRSTPGNLRMNGLVADTRL